MDELARLIGNEHKETANQTESNDSDAQSSSKRDMGNNVIMMPELEGREAEQAKPAAPAKQAAGGESFPDWDDPGFEEV